MSARRYGGVLIHHSRDADGALEVVEAHGVRALHFGTPPRQSALSLQDPGRLELPYVRAMLSALLFADDPRRVLLAGLGGGSLARFALERFPDCQVEAVERRAGVPEIAHAYFGLPRTPRLRVHIADAREHVVDLAEGAAGAFDWVLVDAYDHLGMDPAINALEFVAACARLLRPEGALSMNLWGSHAAALRQSTELLRQCFPGRAFKLAVPNRGNVIGLGLGEAVDPSALKRLLPKARELEFRTGLEMPYFLRNLRPL